MNQKEVREFFSKSQHAERQKDRFGDIYTTSETQVPSFQEISNIPELVLAFCADPSENVDFLVEKRDLLPYLPMTFVEQLNESPFFSLLSEMIKTEDQIHKSLLIISGCISPKSPFIESLLIFQSISVKLSELPFIQIRSSESCSLLGILDRLIFNLPSTHPEIVLAAEECVKNILTINLGDISDKFYILKSFAKRISNDRNEQDLLTKDFAVLLQIVDSGSFKIANSATTIQSYILTPGYPIEFIKSNLILLNKIIMQYHLCMQFANPPFINKMIEFLGEDEDFDIKTNTLNIMNSLICEFGKIKEIDRNTSPNFRNNPVDMLLDRGLLPLLYKFSQDNPRKLYFAFNPVTALCTLAPRYVEMVCQNRFAELIPFAIQNSSFNGIQSAIWLASNIFYKGSAYEIQQLLQPLVIDTMMQFIEEESVITNIILDGIYCGIQAEAENGVENLKTAFQTEPFFALLQTCTANESSDIADKSQRLIQIFAPQ